MAGDGSSGRGSPRARPSGGTRRTTEAAVALFCLLGLFVAAVAAPSLATGPGAAPDSGAGPDGGPGADPARGPGGGSGGGGDGPSVLELLELIESLLSDAGSSDGTRTASACDVAVKPKPTPGREVAVLVIRHGRPVEGATVRFNEARVGRTDASGTVRARVPYVRELVVTATLPGDVTCGTAASPAALGDAHAARASVGVGVAPASGGVEVTPASVGARTAVPASTAGATVPPSSRRATAPSEGSNVSRTLPVDGEVRLAVDGRPDPGTKLPLRASIEGVPMRAATVTVNGRRVGVTDDAGRYVLAVPGDGTETLHVRVKRGAFAGERTLVVRLLSARVAPDGPLAFPGRSATLHAALGAAPARNATVMLDGRRLGTTDARGRLRFRLPADPLATLTVRIEGRTATSGVWLPYATTALVVGIPALVLMVAGVLAFRRGATPRRVGGRLGRLLDRLLAVAVGVALRVVTGLDRAVTWLAVRVVAALARARALVRRLAAAWPGRLAAVPSLLRTLRSRLAAVPGRIVRGLVALAGWLRRGPRRLRALLGGRRDATAAPTAAGMVPGPRAGPAPFDLRAAWRTVARRVSPTAWRTRTPGEIVALAPRRELPRDPVERLATVFEEVEYGHRPFGDDRRDRAADAFAAIEAHWRDRASQSDGDGAAREGGREPPPETDAGVTETDPEVGDE